MGKKRPESPTQELRPHLSRVTQAGILLADWLIRIQQGRNVDEMKILEVNKKLVSACDTAREAGATETQLNQAIREAGNRHDRQTALTRWVEVSRK